MDAAAIKARMEELRKEAAKEANAPVVAKPPAPVKAPAKVKPPSPVATQPPTKPVPAPKVEVEVAPPVQAKAPPVAESAAASKPAPTQTPAAPALPPWLVPAAEIEAAPAPTPVGDATIFGAPPKYAAFTPAPVETPVVPPAAPVVAAPAPAMPEYDPGVVLQISPEHAARERAAFDMRKGEDPRFDLMLEEAQRRGKHAAWYAGNPSRFEQETKRHVQELTKLYAGGDLGAYLKRVDEVYPGGNARAQLTKALNIDERDLPVQLMAALPVVMAPVQLATSGTLPAVDKTTPPGPAWFTADAKARREAQSAAPVKKIDALEDRPYEVSTSELDDLNVGQAGGSAPNTVKATASVGAQNAAHQIMRVLASEGGEDELFKYVEPFSQNGDWLTAQREIAARFYPKVVARYPKLSKNAAEHKANLVALQYLAALRTTGSWTGPIYVSKAALEGGEFKRQYVPTPALDVEVVGVGAQGNIILRAVPLAASIMQGVFGTIESAGIGGARYVDKKSDIEAERQKDSLRTRNVGGERIPLSTFDPNLLPIEAEHNTRAVKMDPILDKREGALSLKNEVASALAEQAALPTEAGRYAEAHQLGSWEALGLSGLAMIGSTIIPGPGEVAALARMGLVGEKNIQSLGRVGELLKKTQSPAVDVAIDALTSTPGIDRILVGESAPALRTLEGGVESATKAIDAYNEKNVAEAVTHLEAAELAEQKLRNASDTREVPVLNAEGEVVGKKKVATGTAPMVMEAVDRMEGELTTRFLNEQGGVRSEADLRAVNALSDTGVANAMNRLDMIAKARGLEPWSQDVNLATAKRRMDNVKFSVRYGAAKDLRELENVKRALEAAPITDAERVAHINDRVLRGSGVGEDVAQALNSFDYLKFMRADDVDSQAITVALFKHVADELGIGDNIADPRFEKFIAARDLITKNIVRESNLQKMLDDVPGLIDTAQRAVMMKRELRSTAAALVTRIARRTGGKIMSLGEAQALTKSSPGLKLGVHDVEAAPKIDLKTGAPSDGDKLSQLIGFFNRYQVPKEERLSPGAARLLSKATAFFRGDVKAARINLALIDAVARNWSDATGRPSAEWWRTRIGDIRVADSRDVNVGDAFLHKLEDELFELHANDSQGNAARIQDIKRAIGELERESVEQSRLYQDGETTDSVASAPQFKSSTDARAWVDALPEAERVALAERYYAAEDVAHATEEYKTYRRLDREDTVAYLAYTRFQDAQPDVIAANAELDRLSGADYHTRTPAREQLRNAEAAAKLTEEGARLFAARQAADAKVRAAHALAKPYLDSADAVLPNGVHGFHLPYRYEIDRIVAQRKIDAMAEARRAEDAARKAADGPKIDAAIQRDTRIATPAAAPTYTWGTPDAPLASEHGPRRPSAHEIRQRAAEDAAAAQVSRYLEGKPGTAREATTARPAAEVAPPSLAVTDAPRQPDVVETSVSYDLAPAVDSYKTAAETEAEANAARITADLEAAREVSPAEERYRKLAVQELRRAGQENIFTPSYGFNEVKNLSGQGYSADARAAAKSKLIQQFENRESADAYNHPASIDPVELHAAVDYAVDLLAEQAYKDDPFRSALFEETNRLGVNAAEYAQALPAEVRKSLPGAALSEAGSLLDYMTRAFSESSDFAQRGSAYHDAKLSIDAALKAIQKHGVTSGTPAASLATDVVIQAYKKVPVHNFAQYAAREVMVALLKGDTERAMKRLTYLQSLMNDGPAAWYQRVGELDHNFVLKPGTELAVTTPAPIARKKWLGLFAGESSAPRGFIEFVEDNKAVITGLESRDPSTFIHEVGHLLRSDLSPRDMDALVTELRGKGIHVLHDNRGHFIPESAAKLVDEVDSAIAESLTEVEAEVQVKPETKSAIKAEPPENVPVAAFKTAKGSTYDYFADQTSTRNKAARTDVGHEGDSGPKKRSAITVFATPDAANALALPQGGSFRFNLDPVRQELRLLTRASDADDTVLPNIPWGSSPTQIVKFTTTPEKGLIPIELWRGTGKDEARLNGVHFGNEIIEVTHAPKAEVEAPASIKDEAADAPERVEVEEDYDEEYVREHGYPTRSEAKAEPKPAPAAPKGFTTPTPDEVRVLKDQLRTRDTAKLRVDKTRAEMAPFADDESRATDVYAALVKRLKSEEEKLATAEANVTPGTQASVDYAAAATKATEFEAEVKLLADKINDFAAKKIRLTPAQAKKLAKDITEARANLRDAEAKMATAKSIIEQHPVPAAPKASNSLAAAQKELQAKAKTQAKTEAKTEVKAETHVETNIRLLTLKLNKDALLPTPRLKDVAQRRKAIAAAEEAVEKHKAGIEAVPAELHNTNAYKNAVAKLPELEAKLAAAQSVVSEKAHARYEYTRAVGAYNDALTAYKRAVKKGDAAEELVELQMSADAVQAANDAFMALPPTEPRAQGVAKPAPMSLAAKAAAEAAKAADRAAEKAVEKAAKDAEKATEKAAAKPEKSEKAEVTSKSQKPSASDEAAAEKAMKSANATAAKEVKAAEKAAKDAEKAAAKAEKVAAAKAATAAKAPKLVKRVSLDDIMNKPRSTTVAERSPELGDVGDLVTRINAGKAAPGDEFKAEPKTQAKTEVAPAPKPEPQAYVSPDAETWTGPVVERTRFRNVEPVAKTSAKPEVKAVVKPEAPKLTVEGTYVHDGLNSQNPAFNDEKVNTAIGNIKNKPPFKTLTDAQKGEFTPYLYAIIDLVGGKTATQALERNGVRAADGVAAILEASAKDPKAEQDAASAKVARQRAVHALKELVSKKLADMGADELPVGGYTSPKNTRFYQGEDAQTSAKPGIHPEVRRAEEAYADMVEDAFKGEGPGASRVTENISAHLQSLGAALTREGKAIKVPVSPEVERMMEPFMRDEPTTGPFGRAKDTRTPNDNLLPTELTAEDLVNPVATHEKIKADIEHFKGLEHTQNESFAEEIAALETKRQLLLASPEHKAAVSAALQEKYDFIVQKEYPSENDLKLAARIKQRIASLAPKPELETRASTAANPESLKPELRAYAELNIPTTEKPLNLGTNNRAASVVEDTVHGGIYQSLAGSPKLQACVSFFLGIGADEDHAFRAMPPEARRITMSAGVRPIQEYNADISRLVSEWARDPDLEDSVFAYLNGEATRFGDDSPTLTSGGTNHTEWAIQQLQARWNAMTLEEQQKIEAYAQSCGRDKNGLIKPFSGPEEISDMTSAVGLINKILKRADYTDNTAAPGDAFINLARQSVWHAGSADDASTRPQIQAWFLSLLDAADVFEDSRAAAKETNPSRRLVSALAAHTPDNIKAPHHAAVLLGTYGGMREVGDAFLSQSFGVTREDAQLYARWRQGLAIPAGAMPRVTEMAKRYGLEADFTLVPELDVGALLLPRETRVRIQQELLHGRRLLSAEEKLGLKYGAKTKDVLSGEYKRNFIEGFAQRSVERVKNMNVFGNLFMRAPSYINDTQGLFEATGAAGGLATASRMAARRSSTMIFTNVPLLSQIMDSINWLSKIKGGPGSKVAKLMTRGRQALSKAADASINLFSALITFNSANRNNPRVVDILEGGTQIIETPNGPMTRNQVRAILRQEGVFATFERGQMAEALFNEGSSDGNAVSRAYGRVANSVRRHRYETNYAISVQTRVGNALAFMEMGYDPRTAGRLALMTAYDYVNTSSGWDKHIIYNVFFPFQSFRKNNSRFILNRVASYNGIRKLAMATRLVGTFPQTLANFLEAMDRDEGDRYGVDEGALSPEARNEFNRFTLLYEEGFAPLYGANPEKWPDIVKRNLAGKQDFSEYYAGLSAEGQEFLSFGYGGYENVPTSVKAFVNEYINGYQRDVMAGSVMERKVIEDQEHGNIDSYAPMDWRSATTKQRFGDTSRFQYEYMLNRPSATIRPRPGANVNDYVRDRDAQRIRSSKGSGTDSLNAYTMNMTETNTAAYATWLGCSLTLMAGTWNVVQTGGEHIFDADPADIEAWHNDLKNGNEYSIEPSRTSDFYGFTEFVRTNKDAIDACSDPERAILLGNFVRMAGGEDSAITINPALYGLIDAASLPLPLDKTVVGGQERRTMSPAAKALMEINPYGMIFLEANDFANRTMPVVNALSGKAESMLSAQVMDAQERGETLSPAFILSAAKAAGFNVSEVVPSSVMYREGPEFTKKTTTPE